MNVRNCGKPIHKSSNPQGRTAPAGQQMAWEKDTLFPTLWVLGFNIICELLLFAARELVQTILHLIANVLPSGIASYIMSYLSNALSAFFLILIFASGICFYSIWKQELRPLFIKIVSTALFAFGHAAAAFLSDGLTAIILLSAGMFLDLSCNDVAVTGTILSFLFRIACETALVRWAVKHYGEGG